MFKKDGWSSKHCFNEREYHEDQKNPQTDRKKVAGYLHFTVFFHISVTIYIHSKIATIKVYCRVTPYHYGL